jgi:hypothetical protein
LLPCSVASVCTLRAVRGGVVAGGGRCQLGSAADESLAACQNPHRVR